MPIAKSSVRLSLCSFIKIFSKGKRRKITTWDKRCIMLYWILGKKPIQVDSKALGQKPLEWANRCIIDGKVLKVTKKKANNISRSHTSHLSNKIHFRNADSTIWEVYFDRKSKSKSILFLGKTIKKRGSLFLYAFNSFEWVQKELNIF